MRCDRNWRPGEKKEFSFYSINTEQLFRVTDYCVPVLQPKLTEEAGQKLIDHYVSMRKIGAGRGQVSLPSNSLSSFSLLVIRQFKTLCALSVRKLETIISDFDMLIFYPEVYINGYLSSFFTVRYFLEMELKPAHTIETYLNRPRRRPARPRPRPHPPPPSFYGITHPPPPPLQLKFSGGVAKRGLYLLILKKFRVRIAVDFINNSLPK